MAIELIFPIVKKHIDEMDYASLLPYAPADEYDIESMEIAKKITAASTAPEIAAIIADVFNAMFSDKHDETFFMDTAIKIQNDLICGGINIEKPHSTD